MCVVSYVGDYWGKQAPIKHPWIQPYIPDPYPIPNPLPPWSRPEQSPYPSSQFNPPTREEFEALKKEMEELKKLLLAAKKYDEETGEPDCEVEDKVALIKKIAKLVGVDMEEVFGDKA